MLLSLAGALALAGCDDSVSSTVAEISSGSPPAASAQVERLIEFSTPLDPNLTSDHHDKQLHAWRALLAELKSASPAVGRSALATFEELEAKAEPAPMQVRVNLLTVAAHAATEETQPLLEKLLLEYGHRIDIRTEATFLLGEVAPSRAVELIEPFLRKTRNASTMPDDEFLLKGYVTGCTGAGVDPVPVLVDMATNIFKQDAARHLAIKELGKHPTLQSQQALRAILVESTGNAYLRRKAAQAIRDVFPREEACAIFELISSMEADNSFLIFLADMIEQNCN